MRNKLLRLSLVLFIISLILFSSYCVLKGMFPVKYEDIITECCEEYGVDKYLVIAVIKAESGFKEDAASAAGAKGLMQITDSTFSFCRENMDYPLENIFFPEDNIRAGVWYLSEMLKRYDGNTKNALAAYNAGFANVDKWLSDKGFSSDGNTLDSIPFGETGRYTEKVEKYRKIYITLY